MLQGDGYYYWLYNPGTSPREVLVKSKHLKRDFGKPPSSDGGGPVLIFDPNQEEDTSLYMYSWSPNGRYWTAILQKAGSDWQNIRTIDTEIGQAVEDDLTGAKFTFGATWVYDTAGLPFPQLMSRLTRQGFIYKATISKTNGTAFSSMDGTFGIFYHRLNTPQAQDILVWHGGGVDAASQIVGRPHVMSAKETDPSRRSWMLWDIYRNTNPETETFVIELPADGEDMGERLKEAVGERKRWLTKGWTGQTTCKCSTGYKENSSSIQILERFLLIIICFSQLRMVWRLGVSYR
jgi:prolyl oligopeptidase